MMYCMCRTDLAQSGCVVVLRELIKYYYHSVTRYTYTYVGNASRNQMVRHLTQPLPLEDSITIDHRPLEGLDHYKSQTP